MAVRSAGVAPQSPVTPIPASGASQALAFPPSGDVVYDITLSAACTLTLGGGTAGRMQRVTLLLRQPAGAGYAVTLPTNVRYLGGSAPPVSTTPGAITLLEFTTSDAGATIIGR